MYNSLWRNGGITPNVWGLDAKCLFPFIPFLLHIALWTFVSALVCTIFFWALSYKGYSIEVALGKLRCWIVGTSRTVDSNFDQNFRGWY